MRLDNPSEASYDGIKSFLKFRKIILDISIM